MFIIAQSTINPILEWVHSLGAAGAIGVCFALMTGWLITRREADAKDKQITELKAERDEWRNLYLRRQGVVEDAVDLAKHRRP